MTKRSAVIVDCDGTLVDVSSIRHYVTKSVKEDGSYTTCDFDSFHKASLFCPAIWSTIDQVEKFWMDRRYDVLVVTARGEQYRQTTKDWLHKYSVGYTKLFMRPMGDYRPDREVKSDILDEIEQTWNVIHAIDDNPAVISLWRDRGISVTEVPGWVE